MRGQCIRLVCYEASLGSAEGASCTTGLSSQQLMEKGRKEMKAQDDSLIRAQRIVESTIEVGRPHSSVLSLKSAHKQD